MTELWQLTGDSSFIDLAQSGLSYERSTYSKENIGWRDNRSSSENKKYQPIAGNAWCHGRGGIWLAHGLIGHVLKKPLLDKIVDVDCGIILTEGIKSDCLCHGLVGNADTLITVLSRCPEVTN